MNKTKTVEQYTVIYRTGGSERFTWHRLAKNTSLEIARKDAEEIERMGYKTLIHKTKQLDAIGLPETFE